MSIPQEQYDRLIAYFEGKLSAEEEISFLHEVKEDEALQKEFDWELLLRYQHFEEPDEADKSEHADPFEPAGAHTGRVKEAWKQAAANDPLPPVRIIRPGRFTVAAAILVLALGAALFYIFYIKKPAPEIVHRDPPVKPDRGRIYKKDPSLPEKNARILAQNDDRAEKVYKQYYKKYRGSEEDPIQVSKFLYAYNEGRYDEVIKGTAKELLSKGTDANTPALKNYLGFYQGISYLHTKKTAPAINKLREVTSHTSSTDQLYYDASWYLAMAYLQDGNLTDATAVLQQLADSKINMGYKKEASSVLKALR